ncbi:MAG: hypothetical protein RMK29_05220 [Myxococcales bacterium]|nr:hypothetical protein [Myxococcota bacterium]MDW8281091.1 hypothetical protein [Myxococcales bacterium]
MRIAWDDLFARERQRFDLRHCCEDCGQFDRRAAVCAHGFPTQGHRQADYEAEPTDILFCKEFELC